MGHKTVWDTNSAPGRELALLGLTQHSSGQARPQPLGVPGCSLCRLQRQKVSPHQESPGVCSLFHGKGAGGLLYQNALLLFITSL